MRGEANPVLAEGWSVTFARWGVARLHAGLAVAFGGIALLAWPKSDYFSFLAAGRMPPTFSVVAVGAFTVLAVVNLLLGGERIGQGQFISCASWMGIGGLPAGRLLAGKLGFAVLHAGLLALLALPALLAAGTPSDVPVGDVLAACALIGVACAAYRVLGLLFLLLLEPHPLLLVLALASVPAVLLATVGLLPGVSPFLALLALDVQTHGIYVGARLLPLFRGFLAQTLALHAGLLAAAGAGCYLRLSVRPFPTAGDGEA